MATDVVTIVIAIIAPIIDSSLLTLNVAAVRIMIMLRFVYM